MIHTHYFYYFFPAYTAIPPAVIASLVYWLLASPQPIRAQRPPAPASIAQIGLTKLQVNLLKFFGFYFSSSGVCQKKNQCGEGTDISNVDLCRSNI